MRVFRRGVPAVLVILLSVLFLKGSTINVPTGTWQSTANMSVARANAVAVLVPDGRIVLAGGADSTGAPTASTEAFSADGTFSALPAMSTARARHAAIYTMTGDLLVTGGVTAGGGFTNTAEAFDSLTSTWHSLSATLVEARAGHTMSQLQNGNVLIAGGENSSGPVAALEIYDITSGQFSFAGTLSTARKGHAAAVLNDGRVLIIGGTTVQSDGTSATLSSTEIYDPSTGQVSAGPSLSTPRTDATATTLLDGRVLIVGGSYPEAANGAAPELASAEIYDPVSNTFTPSASHLATARAGHLAFLLPNNNNVLIAGGTATQPDGTVSPLASAELYTPWTDTFAPTQSMSTARDAATGSALANTYYGLDGLFLIAGGKNLDSADVYGFATVKTDNGDYAPGEAVTITGSGWQPGETVTLALLESPNVDTHPPLTAVADANGNIFNNQFVPDEHDLNVRFFLTAQGSQSAAQNTFTDSVTSVTITSPTTGSPITLTSLPATITVSFNYVTSATGTTSAQVDVLGLASTSISSLTSGTGSASTTLTLPAGATNANYNLKVTVTNTSGSGSNNKNDNQNAAVIINVPACAAPSVTTQPLNQTVTYGSNASFTAAASGTPAPSIQWQVNTGSGFTDIGGATSSTLTITSPLVSATGNQYRAVFTNTCGGLQTVNSTAATLTVNQASTTTSLTSSTNPSVFGQSVTFTANVGVVAPGVGTPTGTVTFKDGASTLGTGTVDATGVATFTTSVLNVATHSVTAAYSGDANFSGSTSSPLSQVVNKADTTTVLASSVNPSVFGQSVTFTATVSPVAPGAGTPTGTVNFMDGVASLGSGTLNGSGVATFSTSGLNVASHSITAVYADDSNFNGSTSSAVTQVVNKADTTTVLTSSVNPSVFGESVSFTATVNAVAPGVGTATGTVTFRDGATVLGSAALSGGTATFTTSALNVTSHSITAVYGSDANFNGSTSSAVAQIVNKADTATSLSSSANPSVFGQSVTFTATVSPVAPGSGSPTGTVTFMDGATTLGTGTLSGGVATFTTGSLTVTSHSITAMYGTDANFNGSTSAAVTQVVNKAETTTLLTSSVNPSVFGQSVTFTATVAAQAPGSGTPTGTVIFMDGATTLATGTLSGGVATLTTSTLSVGSHPIAAVYGADANFNGSTSPAVTQVVNKADTTTTLTSSANPSVFGQSVTFTATVSPVAPGSGTPTGTVTFVDGAITLGSSTLSGGVATFTTSGLSVASHPIAAVYGADANFNGSSSPAVTQVVNKADTTTSLNSSMNPSVFGQSVTFTATVSAVAPGSGTPTGTVTFMEGATTLGTGTLSGGIATFTTSGLNVASHSITAVYGSDANFNASTSAAVTQVVNKADTTTILVSSVNPSAFGQSVTFTATVSPVAPGSGNPTGTLTFKDGVTVLGTATLSGGAAILTTSGLSVGGRSITASYSGDTNFNISNSSMLTQIVNKADTSASVVSSANPSVFGQSVTFTATISVVAPGAGTPTGTVTFMDGALTLGTATLSSNQATLSSSALSVATHSITVIYSGDGNFNTSTSSSLSQIVNKANTQVALTSNPNPALLSQTVTFTATVNVVAPGAGTPTGMVTFLDGATTLGSVTLSGNQVVFTTSTLSLGSHAITATYAGDGNFNGSTSGTVTEQVNYGFIGLLDPYAPPSMRTYKIKSAIPLKWQYTDNSGSVVNSYSTAPPSISIYQYPCIGGSDTTAITLDDAGASGYQYDFTTNTWQFNWKTTGLAPGCYNIYVKNSQSGQTNGGFPIQLSR